jgi:sugar (pentulose or hexulose) kinase
MRIHEPQVFARSAKFLLLEDFLLYRMTGRYITETALQTSSLFLDIQRKAWWQEMLEYVGITADQLGELMDPGEIAAPLSLAGAEALGLTTHTLAVTGSMDQAIGAVGAGNTSPGVVTESTGGAMAIVVSLDKPLYDPQRRVPCYFHARKDAYCLLPWVQTAGMALKWFRDQFYTLEAQTATAQNLDPYDLMTQSASQVPPGSEGLVVLPHLEGAFCPEFNPAARAVFYGATLRHTRAHFTRAILESVAYMLKKNLNLVEGLGVPVREIRSIGGGARSELWLQIKADVLQKPVITVQVEEAALLGAAITAATATGTFASLEEGVERMVRLRRRIEPDPSNTAVYRQGYAAFLELYDRLAPMFR